RVAELDEDDLLAAFASQFDRSAVRAAFVAAQPLVAEAGGGTGPFAGVCAQFLTDLGAAADRRRADVYRAQVRSMALSTSMALSRSEEGRGGEGCGFGARPGGGVDGDDG